MIVVSPTHTWLSSALEACSVSLAIASPYIGEYLSGSVSKLRSNVAVSLLTRTVLTDFASGASNLEAVIHLAHRCGGVHSLNSLHAKVYVVDDRKALVTSANATFTGMYKNRECGLETSEAETIQQLCRLIERGFGSAPVPQQWHVADLESLRGPVDALKSVMPQVLRSQTLSADPDLRVRLKPSQFDRLIREMPGWMKLTMEGIMAIPSNSFTLAEAYQYCAPLARQQYPSNRHVEPKIRQQLQRLRDLGVIKFLGQGRYESLTTVR